MIHVRTGSVAFALLTLVACDPGADPVSPHSADPVPPRADARLAPTTYFALTTLPGRLDGVDLTHGGAVVGRLWNGDGTAMISDFFWSPGDAAATPIPSVPVPGEVFDVAANETGVVVGTTGECDQPIFTYCAYAWSASTGRGDLYPLSDHRTSSARDVNDGGIVVGESRRDAGTPSATLWRLPEGFVTYVGPPGLDTEDYESVATAVNDAGAVVGVASFEGFSSVPFLWTASAGFQVMTALRAAVEGVAAAGGRTVGEVVPLDIANSGVVAGFWTPEGEARRAFVWDPATGLTDLSALGPIEDAVARGLNELGQAALTVSGPPTSPYLEPWVWTAADGLVRLPAPVPGLTVAEAINDRSQTLGWSTDHRTYVWTPLEEAAEVLDALADALDDVLATTPAAGGQGLETKLERIRAHLAEGRANAARNQLEAFLNQLAAMEADGRLSAEDAARLRAAAEALLALLP